MICSDELVAFFDGLAEVAAAEVLQIRAEGLGEEGLLAVGHGLGEIAEDGGAAGEGLETAAVAAIAFGAADFDDHVADFARGPAEAGI